MKKKCKLMLAISLTLLLTGCNLTYYKIPSTQVETPTDTNDTTVDIDDSSVEDFYKDSATTYVENTTNKTLQTLYQNCKKTTVTIETYVTYTDKGTTTTGLYSSGSGFIVKESDNYLYIYTNAHVVTVEKEVSDIDTEVILNDYSRYSATIVGKDENEDVAIVRISKPSKDKYLVAALADISKVSVAEPVFAIGSPLGFAHASTITSGIVSGVNVELDNDGINMYLIQTDTAINPGNSGGPLFNYNGEVIGINTLKILESESGTPVEGMGFAIPINHFDLVASTLLNGETYSRAKIGITVMNIPTLSLDIKKEYNINVDCGLYIDEVSNTSSNLVANTIITHINDVKVITGNDFSVELYNHKAGDVIKVTYTDLNGNNPTTIDLTLI